MAATSLHVGDLVTVYQRPCVVHGFTPQGVETPHVYLDDVDAPGVQLVIPMDEVHLALTPPRPGHMPAR